MKNKLIFLTKMSLNKKIKTKWFLIANFIFAVLIIGLINIDTIIKTFGGDFNEAQEIIVIDEASVYEQFTEVFSSYQKYMIDDSEVIVSNYQKTYEEGIKEVEDDNKILLLISLDSDNYLTAKLVSNESLGTIMNTLIGTTLTKIRSEMVLEELNITDSMYEKINKNVEIESITLSDEFQDDNMMISSIMQVITLPLFMLIIFLVQMIGAEVNEEKSTKSMEIIISNVSPKTHFMSKIIASNLFVIMQGLLLIIFVLLGLGLRYILSGGNMLLGLDEELGGIVSGLSLSSNLSSLSYIIPIIFIMLLLTFFAYSLLAGILASMTTNLEDFQQLQTPIVIILLAGYYLSLMTGLFKGSIFIKIMSYIPLVSSMLAPTLFVLGEISIFDLLGSIILLLLLIFFLIKYGLKVYKAGILNYSQSGLWKKMIKALKEK